MVSGEMGLSEQSMLAPPTVYSDAAADNAAMAYSPENYQPVNGGMQSFAPTDQTSYQTPGFPPPMTIDGNLAAGDPATESTTFAAGEVPGLGAMPPETAPQGSPETADLVAAEMQNLATAVESLATIITQAPDIKAAVHSPEFNGQLDALVASAEQLGQSAADSGLQQMQPGAVQQDATPPIAAPTIAAPMIAPPVMAPTGMPPAAEAIALPAGELPSDPYAFSGGEMPAAETAPMTESAMATEAFPMTESAISAEAAPMTESAMPEVSAPVPETAAPEVVAPVPETAVPAEGATAEALSPSPAVAGPVNETVTQPGTENLEAAAPLESGAEQPETTTDQLQKKLDQVKADLVKLCEGDVSPGAINGKVLEIMRAAMLVGFSERAAELGQSLSVADIESIFPPAPPTPAALPADQTGAQPDPKTPFSQPSPL